MIFLSLFRCNHKSFPNYNFRTQNAIQEMHTHTHTSRSHTPLISLMHSLFFILTMFILSLFIIYPKWHIFSLPLTLDFAYKNKTKFVVYGRNGTHAARFAILLHFCFDHSWYNTNSNTTHRNWKTWILYND